MRARESASGGRWHRPDLRLMTTTLTHRHKHRHRRRHRHTKHRHTDTNKNTDTETQTQRHRHRDTGTGTNTDTDTDTDTESNRPTCPRNAPAARPFEIFTCGYGVCKACAKEGWCGPYGCKPIGDTPTAFMNGELAKWRGW